MMSIFRELLKYRELLYMITWRDIHIKYKQSVMGFMWAILMPMFIIAVGILVRFGIAKFSGQPLDIKQIVTVSVKAIPWAFFHIFHHFCHDLPGWKCQSGDKDLFPQGNFSAFSRIVKFV